MRMMKAYIPFLLVSSLILFSCAPVLSRNYMGEGDRRVSFDSLRTNPDVHKGRLFILGGVVVRSQFTEAGSRLEAVHVPVDSYGYFEERGRSEGRFIALALKDGPSLDPVVYTQGRRVTVAAEFIETQKGKIDEMEYNFPVFLIRQIYLWPKETRYAYPPMYYDPWIYPYPYYYRHPWWGYPYYPYPPFY